MNLWLDRTPTASARPTSIDAIGMEERRRQIQALIETTGRVSSDELALRFNTSAVTIRSDLRALAASGALLRTHGGAVAHREGDEVPLAIRAGHHHAQMIRVARQVIAVADSSKLQRRNLSVIGAVECLDMLITDVHAHPSVVNALRDRGVDVMVV